MEHGSSKKKILVISPTPPIPTAPVTGQESHSLMTSMLSLGHEVHFLHIEKEAGDRDAMRACWAININLLSCPACRRIISQRRDARSANGWARKGSTSTASMNGTIRPPMNSSAALAAKIGFDAVIAEYVFFSGALRCFGDGVLKLLDTHDAFYRPPPTLHRRGKEAAVVFHLQARRGARPGTRGCRHRDPGKRARAISVRYRTGA